MAPRLGLSKVEDTLAERELQGSDSFQVRLIGSLRCLWGPRSLTPRRLALLAREELAVLSREEPDDLRRLLGLTEAQARRLHGAFRLGRLIEEARGRPGQPLTNPSQVYRLMAPRLRGLERETFLVLLLDARHRCRAVHHVSTGTLTSSLVHPREVFRPAVRAAAAALVAVHNHPSGDPAPSSEDHAVTRRLVECGRMLGIPLLDHVVIGAGRWHSLRGSESFAAGRQSW